MAVESADDLASFFDADDFAEGVLYRAGGTGREIRVFGLFDSAHVAPGLAGLGADAREITFRCLASAVPAVQQGDTLAVGAVVYRVRSVRPDGNGTVTLVLAVT
jgi:hypothetical protein